MAPLSRMRYFLLAIFFYPGIVSAQQVVSESYSITPHYFALKDSIDKEAKSLQRQLSMEGSPVTKKSFVQRPYVKFIIPSALIAYGAVTRESKALQDFDHDVAGETHRHRSVDNYLQFVPATAVYALDLAGIKAKHNFRDRTIVMLTSHLLMGSTVHIMKSSIPVMRPDGSNTQSFPSGHTATAFVGAHILCKEYKDASLWIPVSGYLCAVGTGAFRVLNNKHWVSDVVTGAGVGMMSVELSYLMLPLFHRVLGVEKRSSNKQNKQLVVVPSYFGNQYGVGISYQF